METGQMNTKMTDTPLLTTATVSSQTQSVQKGEQDGSAFAGILRGITPQAPAQPVVMAVVVTELLTGKVIDEAFAEQIEKDVEQKNLDLIPQDVVMNAALAQSAQALQVIGRMPGLDQNADAKVEPAGMKAAALNTADAKESIQQLTMEVSRNDVAEKTPSAQVTAETLITPKEVEPLSVAIGSSATPAQRGTVETMAAPQTVTVKVEVSVTTQNISSGGQVFIETEYVSSERESELSMPKISVKQIMEAYSRPALTISNASVVAPQEQQRPVEAVAESVPSTQKQGAQKPTLMPVLTVIPEQTQTEAPTPSVQKASEAGIISARAAVETTDGLSVIKEERLQQQAPAASVAKTASSAEDVLPVAVKEVSPATTGQESWNGDKPSTYQEMNGQVNQLLQQPMKTENVATASSTTAPVPGSTAGVSEHVARQVSEHLANHEIKTGSEQIVLRLSPENLGELKVNLRMENQRLTVEIVTDNRMVRDVLLQHSDTLKDSLAKQNIKMDTFDVSTGSNNSGFESRSQNEWRELARNRQSQQWASGGYRIPSDVVTPTQHAYLVGTEHSMLDLHF